MNNKISILIVEDERIVATDMKMRLQSLGYEVVGIAISSEEALSFVKGEKPNLVLMDIKLKGKTNGIVTAGILKEMYDIPVVYVTAYADQNNLARIKETEPFGIISKPCEDKELMNVIETALHKYKIERQLKESEENLRITLNSITDAVISTDREGKVVSMNPMAENLTGWTFAEAQGKPITKVFYTVNMKTGKRCENPVQKVLKYGKTVNLSNQTSLIAKDSTEYPIADSGSPIRDDNGNIIGVVLVFRDVTEEYLMQEELHEKEERLLAVYKSSPTIIIVSTIKDGRFIEVNKAFTKFSGWKSEEAIGKTALDLGLWAESAYEQRQELINELREKGSVKGHEFIFQDRNGNKMIGLLSAEIIKIKGKKYMLANVVNVTERKRMEQALRESEKNYRLLADTTNDVIWKIDFKKNINLSNAKLSYVSPSVERIAGYTPQETLDKKISDILPPHTIQMAKDLFIKILDKEKRGVKVKGQTLELEHYCKNGSIRWMECNMSFLRNRNGNPVAIIGVGRNITERKQIEKEKEGYLQELKFITDTVIAISRMDDVDEMCQFLGKAIHSINTKSYVAVLLYDPDLDAIRIRTLIGFDKVMDRLLKIIGKDLTSILFYPKQLQKEITKNYTIGKLEYVSGGLFTLLGEKFNKSVCQDIEQLLGIGNVYTVGFTLEDVPNGGITILIPTDHEVQYKSAIETLVTHFSVLILRKQVEDALWESKERYQNFIKQSFEGIYRQEFKKLINTTLSVEKQIDLIYDNAYIAECNQAMASMYHMSSPEDLIGLRMVDLHGGKNNPVNRAAVKKFVESNYKIIDEETVEITSDGNIVYFSNNTIGIVENGFLIRMWGTQLDITERKKAEKQIKKDLEEKDILLKEIHHRVKNNLQVIRSLIHMQLTKEKNPAFQNSATELSNRILSMAMIHEYLYSSENIAVVNLKTYIESFLNKILQSYVHSNITIVKQLEDIHLSLDQSVPIGLLINELITNAVKHAFPKYRKGKIIITLSRKQNLCELKVKDNGIGIPTDINFRDPSTLGLKLVNILANQLEGTVQMYRQKGTLIKLTIPIVDTT